MGPKKKTSIQSSLSRSVDISFKDDVTVVLLLSLSFIQSEHIKEGCKPLPARKLTQFKKEKKLNPYSNSDLIYIYAYIQFIAVEAITIQFELLSVDLQHLL
jgi:hypothetical protein